MFYVKPLVCVVKQYHDIKKNAYVYSSPLLSSKKYFSHEPWTRKMEREALQLLFVLERLLD